MLHDWGSALGFDWARRHATQVAGIAYMEAIVRPLAWEEFPAGARRIFQGFRSAEGASMIIERNLFVERVLPSGVLRDLGEDHDVYRRPYETSPDRRRLMLEWPRQLPIDGHPRAVVDVVRAYADWLSGCTVPKLFINGEPGSLLVGAQREFCRTWPNQHEVTVPGIHFLPEDSPGLIGEAISEWMERRKMR